MSSIVEAGKRTIEAEIAGLQKLVPRIDGRFEEAVRKILACRGKVVLSGMGKPGHIGRKAAASFASTGTPAFFVHPAEALHGDSGMIRREDLVIVMSNSGETAEVLAFVAIVKRIGAEIIAMTGRPDSTLARSASLVLDVGVEREADPLNLAPTTSALVTLAMCDALVVATMIERGFSAEDFALFHPGGALGERLRGRTAG